MKRTYVIVEHFRGGDARPVYERFRARGRLAPEGLTYVTSWVDRDLSRCFQVMETHDPGLLERWMEQWRDLVDFEVHEVIDSATASERVLSTVIREARPSAVSMMRKARPAGRRGCRLSEGGAAPLHPRGGSMPANRPANTQRVVPYLYYQNGKAAIDFIAKAFGFEVRTVMSGPGDSVMHAELGLGDSVVYLGTPPGARPAAKLPRRNASVLVYVDDVDAHCARAKRAGAVVVREPADQFYGDRTYTAQDPEGQEWFFHTHVRDVSEAEMQAALASMPAPQPAPKPRAKRKTAKASKPAKRKARKSGRR